ncbi:Polysialic acid O-acetyltransferase [Liparis tanakae]|uniref:Polysialic acid O-acetyltransferase n=1 Tax=Liparis tanakae TaxID=230148 RepID=A0A4Z2F6D0_9TELE|nr:Polysialic acid O-acetyltransferase [Liparis tanakae]
MAVKPHTSKSLMKASGVPDQDSRVLIQDSRVLDQDSGFLHQDSRVVHQDSRVLNQDSKVLMQDSRVLHQDSRDSRVLNQDSGVPHQDSGVPHQDSSFYQESRLSSWSGASRSAAPPRPSWRYSPMTASHFPLACAQRISLKDAPPMMKTMTRGPVRYSPGVLFLCQWPYRALPGGGGETRGNSYYSYTGKQRHDNGLKTHASVSSPSSRVWLHPRGPIGGLAVHK